MHVIFYFVISTILYMAQHFMFTARTRLEYQSSITFKWFKYHCMKINSGKCCLIVSDNKYEHLGTNIGDGKIWQSKNS